MRRAYNGQFVFVGDTFMGVCLGADYVSEHEWGIKGLKQAFGIKEYDVRDTSKVSVARRAITNVPDELALSTITVNGSKIWVLYYDRSLWGDELTADYVNRILDLTPKFEGGIKQIFSAAWDERSFAIASDNEKLMTDLYESIKKKDCVVGLFGGGVFKNAGLSIYIASAISDDIANSWKDSDESAAKLYLASDETGIRAKIDENNKKYGVFSSPTGYFALSPRFYYPELDKKTAHPVVYWLNPEQQHNNNYGIFTVEELEQWIEGKGPIVKKKIKNSS